jgi:peptidoglycan/LPS O-acetylase OafA/YrhL
MHPILRPAPPPTTAAALPTPDFRLGHRPALDGLRGCAILAVLLHHTFPTHLPGGFFGVDVFFVLSGFLITVLLLQEWRSTGAVSLPHFYLRRGLRLLPALCVCLLASWLFARWCYTPADARLTGRGALAVLFYYFNWKVLSARVPYYLLVHTWSLSVEEQFYLVWPLVLVVLLRLGARRRWILGVVAAGIPLIALERILLLWHTRNYGRLYYGTDTRADGLLAGCLVGLLASWDLLPRRGWPLAVLRAAALLAVPVLLWHGTLSVGNLYVYRGGLSLVALSTATLLAALLHRPPRWLAWPLELPWLAWLGRVSYGLYLWHVLVCWHAIPYLREYLLSRGVLRGHPLALQALLEYPAALAVAALSFYLVERPFLALKDRLGRRPRPAPASLQPPASAA